VTGVKTSPIVLLVVRFDYFDCLAVLKYPLDAFLFIIIA